MGTELVLVVYRPNKMIIDSTYIFPLYTLAIEVCDVHQFFKYAMHLNFFFFFFSSNFKHRLFYKEKGTW